MKTIDDWAALHAGFRWAVPERFNIAEVCCARWARDTPDAVAIRYERSDGTRHDHSYRELDRDADRLAAALRKLGVARGDRVALVLPQRFETAVAHIALYRLGAVAMPLSMLFGPDALEYRLNDSEARLAIVDETGDRQRARGAPALREARDRRRGRRGPGAGRRRLARRAEGRARPLRDRDDACRRRGRADLHQRHDRPAEGRADPAPRADRQPATASSAARTGFRTASAAAPAATTMPCSGRLRTGPGPAA